MFKKLMAKRSSESQARIYARAATIRQEIKRRAALRYTD
jgi:hypothetical protein